MRSMRTFVVALEALMRSLKVEQNLVDALADAARKATQAGKGSKKVEFLLESIRPQSRPVLRRSLGRRVRSGEAQ